MPQSKRGRVTPAPPASSGVPFHKMKQLAFGNPPTLVLPFAPVSRTGQLPCPQFPAPDKSQDRIRRETENSRRFLHRVHLLERGLHRHSPTWIPLSLAGSI